MSCYNTCNSLYTALQPERLFCKKGCDSEETTVEDCREQTCNKLCIKEEQGNQKLLFRFLYRAPTDPADCLSSCIEGCNSQDRNEEQK